MSEVQNTLMSSQVPQDYPVPPLKMLFLHYCYCKYVCGFFQCFKLCFVLCLWFNHKNVTIHVFSLHHNKKNVRNNKCFVKCQMFILGCLPLNVSVHSAERDTGNDEHEKDKLLLFYLYFFMSVSYSLMIPPP